MDALGTQVRSDFNKERLKADINHVIDVLLNRPAELLSFDEIKEILHIRNSVYRGIKAIRVEQIIGSLNRNHEFDRAFRPSASISPHRWQSVDRAYYKGVSLPAVSVYKVGEVYFVVDGHHRVSVARKQKQTFIDAEVREFKLKIHFTAKSNLAELEQLCSRNF